jgi:AcrR family transcriptional regulator
MDTISFPAGISRRERRKLQMRERLLAASMELFAEHGCDATSVEQICARADLARKTFYNYFPSKEHLMYVLSEQLIFDESRRQLEATRRRSDSTIEQLRLYLQCTADHLRKFEALERELIRQTIKAFAHDDERAAQRYPDLRNMFCALIVEGQARGEVRTDFSAEILAQIISSAIDAVTVSWVYDDKYPVDGYLLELADYFAVTLRRQPAPGSRKVAGRAAAESLAH